MTSLTINSACSQARSVWFQAELEDLREDGIRWLEMPNATIPAIFSRIAQKLGISNRAAISIGKLIEDQKTAGYLQHSKEFQAMPLAALELFEKAQTLYKSRVKNPDSSGAADAKVMHGQWRGDNYKPGLITKFDDYFVAHIAYYLAIGGWTAVREVRRATGWSLSRLKELLLIAIREINWIKKAIGLRMLNTLSKTVDRGMHFFSSVFAILNAKLKAKDTLDEEIGDDSEEVMDVTLEPPHNNNPDPDDDQEDDTHDQSAPKDDEFRLDDVNQVAPRDREPHAKLKTGRELAFDMLNNAKKAAGGKPRHQQLMEAIDAQILVNALQKDSKNQHETAERMTSFLSYCWQWAECAGIFSEKEYRHLVDAPPESAARQITKAVQCGYWETGDNKPSDPEKIWIDVIHKDDRGREKIAKLVRPCNPGIKTTPHVVNGFKDGRNIILNPDDEFISYFFPEQKKRPSRKNIRYFLTTDSLTETIFCQKLFHPRKSPAHTNTKSFDENEFDIPGESSGVNIEAMEIDDERIAAVAKMLGISRDLLTAAKFGDERALAVVLKAARGMDEDQRDALMDALMPH